MSWRSEAKKQAARKAVDHIESGWVVGLGSGTTTAEGIRILGEKIKTGEIKDILGVPTSYQALQEAVRARIPLTSLDEYPELDFGFDGADQMDGKLNAIKGGGGALLREKIVASCCREYVLIVDETKITDQLGKDQPIYLEVHPFAITPVMRKLKAMGGEPVIRQATGKLGPVVTDNGNNILDVDFGPIDDPRTLNQRLHSLQGVLETGLFIGYADYAYVGTEDSVIKMTR